MSTHVYTRVYAHNDVSTRLHAQAEMLAESDNEGVRNLISEEVRERTDALDALGNTTAAVGKGFAAGSAMLTALALLQVWHHTLQLFTKSFGLYNGYKTSLVRSRPL